MNLADIRKKAKESRASQLPVSEPACAEIAFEQEIELKDYFIEEEYGTPSGYLADDMISSDSLSVFNGQFNDSCPEPEPIPVAQDDSPDTGMNVELHEETAEPEQVSAVEPVVLKNISGFNPLGTILAGRESVSDPDDDSVSHADLYAFEDVEEYLCFRVAHEEYAISIMAIKEIIKPREVTEVPRMPQFISGVISLRGVVIPVMDMRARLSMPASQLTGRERIVVLKVDAGFCGIFVDEVVQVARVKKSCIEAPPAILDGIDREFVSGLGRFDNRMLILLNLATVLDIAIH